MPLNCLMAFTLFSLPTHFCPHLGDRFHQTKAVYLDQMHTSGLAALLMFSCLPFFLPHHWNFVHTASGSPKVDFSLLIF